MTSARFSPTLTSTATHWRNHLSTDDLPGLLDHKLRNDVVFPFAAYIAIAGEAIRRVTHSPRDSGYRLRHAVAHKALLLADTVEISTSLRNHNLNDMDGSSCTYHQDSHTKRVDSGDTPRNADCSRIYNQLSHVCFIYGSHFRGMKSATSSTTIIEEIEISVGADILDARAWRRFRVLPCVEVYAHGNIAFRATGIWFRPLDHDNASSHLLDAHAIARLHRLPHFGFVDTSTLIGSPVVDREKTAVYEKD
ncbi:polyketide synthase dehydratase-domain-containing protein [Fusarium oxysporum]|nr:polyketide synthase dehydratase-domain-containing protein [Fusarium oxysporum]